MKNTFLSIAVLLAASFFVLNTPNTSKAEPPASKAKVNWMSFDKANSYMKENPKKVYIDLYTTWCHWCKVMDNKTLSNPNVVSYLNEIFIAFALMQSPNKTLPIRALFISMTKREELMS
jgi:thiol:disulfide interchange protein